LITLLGFLFVFEEKKEAVEREKEGEKIKQ